ncbi:hypothetical protein KSP40_PGU014795 [Platanthera guangdongensis]|uniref:Uncharacterized protein n=1 Tax=Platanthera guangdongensis TaxID=2320717 RepID=A0ABR2M592_9ASPA
MKENKMLPWSAVGAAGAWALDAERAEAEEAERAAAAVSSAAHSSLFAGDPVQSFPTPKEAAAKTTAKKKKKKGVTIPLSVFTTNTFVGPGDARRDPYFEHRDIAADQMLFLPTGPRERPLEELKNARIGGGIRSYGSGAPRRFDEEVGWGLPPSRARDPAMPSRADEVDSSASVKKPYGPTMDSGRNAAASRADEVDNWSSEKKFSAPLSRQPGFVSGFRAGPERDEEKMLKEEIDHLKKELGKITEGNVNDDSAGQHDNLLEQIQKREHDLDELIREFDDKVRFGHKSGARPGSGSSIAPSHDPSVRSDFSERSSRQTEFADRNRSRATGGSWGRSSRGSGVLECRRMDSFNKE